MKAASRRRGGRTSRFTREDGGRSNGAVAAATHEIREMIRRRELLPGEPVRQQDIAERLEVSRVPIREALHALEKEGLLSHERNRGYFVAKFSADQLDQIYLMRRLFETALMKHLVWPDEQQLSEIAAINAELDEAAEAGEVVKVARLNRQFHEAIFVLSPLATVHQEVNRLWGMSDPYRAFFLAGPSRRDIAMEHEEIIDALRRRDVKELVDALDRHRAKAQDEVTTMLGKPSSLSEIA
jgi:DNA-binding GntR family transcriptional regulator